VALKRLRRLEETDEKGRVFEIVNESAGGMPLPELVARTGLSAAELLGLADGIGLLMVPAASPILVSRARLDLDQTNLIGALSLYHQQHPLEIGMPKVAAPVQGALLEFLLAGTKEIVADNDLLHLSLFKPQLKQDEDEATAKMAGLFRDAGLAVPPVNEVLKNSGIDANRARTLLQNLLRQKTLLRVNSDLIFHAEAIGTLKAALAQRKGQKFGVGEFKEWTGVSRKYAIPLLEFLDRERVTRREGDQRLVL